jgi:hypothetical protein
MGAEVSPGVSTRSELGKMYFRLGAKVQCTFAQETIELILTRGDCLRLGVVRLLSALAVLLRSTKVSWAWRLLKARSPSAM